MPISSPADISNLGLWLDASDLSTLFQNVAGSTPVTTDSEIVGTWLDKHTTNFDLTAQADDTTRPTYHTSAGVHWVEGDGANDLLVRAAVPFYAAGAASFFFALRASNANVNGDTLLTECSSTNNLPVYWPLIVSATVTDARAFIRNTVGTELFNSVLDTTDIFDNTDHVIGVVDTGSLLTLWVDGVEKTGVPYTRSGTMVVNRFSLFGIARGTPSSWIATRVYEGACYTKALNDTEAADISALLTNAFDGTVPVLSNATAAATGQTTASLSVDTDEGDATLYWVVTTSASAPSGAQVAAGQDHTGAAAADSGSQAVSATGTQSISGGATGLTEGTAYWAHFVQDDAAANRSNVASSASFTTEAAPEPPQDEDIAIGAGSIWRDEDENRDKRWKRRRQQLEKISRLVDGISEEIPADVPEAQVVREAEEAVEEAADKLAEDTPPEFFDYAGLARLAQRAETAVREAEDALARYEARKRRELEEADDEDVLLLLG